MTEEQKAAWIELGLAYHEYLRVKDNREIATLELPETNDARRALKQLSAAMGETPIPPKERKIEMGLMTVVAETEQARANHLREENERLRGALQKIIDQANWHTATAVIPDAEGFANWVLGHVATTLKVSLKKPSLVRYAEAYWEDSDLATPERGSEEWWAMYYMWLDHAFPTRR